MPGASPLGQHEEAQTRSSGLSSLIAIIMNTTPTLPPETVRQLNSMFPPSVGLIEFRALIREADGQDVKPGGSFWLNSTDRENQFSDLAQWIAERGNAAELYVGANPRSKQDGKKECIQLLTACFSDLDGQTDLRGVCDAAPLPPNLIVSSGNGIHVYWLIEPSDRKDEWLQAQRGIHAAFLRWGADKACVTDESRILRLVPFPNRKNGKVKNTAIIRGDGKRYKLDEILEAFPFADVKARPQHMAASGERLAALGCLHPCTIQFIMHGAPEGARNTQLFNAACDMHGNLIRRDEIFDVLTPAATASGMGWNEIVRTINSALRKDRDPAIKIPLDSPPPQSNAETSSAAEPQKPLKMPDYPVSPEANLQLARRFAADRPPLVYRAGEFSEYDQKRGCYIPVIDEHLDADIRHFWAKRGKDLKIHHIKEIKSALSHARLARVSSVPAYLADPPEKYPTDVRDLICFRNGMLDLSACLNVLASAESQASSSCLLPPTPEVLNFVSIPHEFTTESSCLEWEKFLNGVLHPQCVAALQEFFGYALTHDTSLHKILVLIGPPRAGKGTILSILREMVGEKNCCAPRLADLGRPFGLYNLMNKSLAILGDASLHVKAERDGPTEILKSISGEDALDVDRKHRDPIPSVRLGVRFVMALNEPPSFEDPSNALSTRMIMLPFMQSFAGSEDYGLKARLLKELPGIVLWSLQGLHRLRQQGRFTEPEVSRDVRIEFEEVTSQIKAFLNQCCKVEPGLETPRKDLYFQYRMWCDENGQRPYSVQMFGVKLRAAYATIGTRRDSHGDRPRFYTGVALINDSGDAMKAA
jgi:P4 family phage/plasmid primase-like protien